MEQGQNKTHLTLEGGELLLMDIGVLQPNRFL